MKTKEQINKSPKKKLIIAGTVVVGVVLLGWLGYMWYQSVTVNYAKWPSLQSAS